MVHFKWIVIATNIRDTSFEMLTGAATLAGRTTRIALFAIVHVPMDHLVFAAEALATIGHARQAAPFGAVSYPLIGTPRRIAERRVATNEAGSAAIALPLVNCGDELLYSSEMVLPSSREVQRCD
jgi:hypothetical protein